MKEIDKIIRQFSKNLKNIGETDLSEIKKIEKGIAISQYCLDQMRPFVRLRHFSTIKSEINFFKKQKPYVHSMLMFLSLRHNYIIDKPKSNIAKQGEYINKKLTKLETKKRKKLEFYRYYMNDEKSLDDVYFRRGNYQLEIFNNGKHFDKDPEFSTNHDFEAAEVLTYNLLTCYYNRELQLLKIKESQQIGKELKPEILTDINWAANKADLVELIYALKESGAITYKKSSIKDLSNLCKHVFNIDLENIYKTYGDIRMRTKDQTKFLDTLKECLTVKMDKDNS